MNAWSRLHFEQKIREPIRFVARRSAEIVCVCVNGLYTSRNNAQMLINFTASCSMSSFLSINFQDIDRSIHQDKASDKNDPKIITQLQIKEGKIKYLFMVNICIR